MSCYEPTTEILTNKGFKSFKNLKEDDYIAQYDENKEITFIKPICIESSYYSGDLIGYKKPINNDYLDILCHPDTLMIRFNGKSLDFKKISDSPFNSRYDYFVAGNNNTITNEYNDFDSVKVAFIECGEKIKDDLYKFTVTNEHQEDYIKNKLTNIKIVYRTELNKNVEIYANWDKEQLYKSYFESFDLKSMNRDSLIDLMRDIKFTTSKGETKNGVFTYNIDDEDTLNFIQSICSMSATIPTIKTSKDHYKLYFTEGHYSKSVSSFIKYTEFYEGFLYSVKVPSKMIIIRKNNTVIVSGDGKI